MSHPSSPTIFCTSESVSFTGFLFYCLSKLKPFQKRTQSLKFVKAIVFVEQQA
ncbi:hypothetical protein NC652_006250 [Populus alba x Populus x berolinensis]|nr:hypothetical protein NC652_006250 [Populus alba x Populus x berolinensis]